MGARDRPTIPDPRLGNAAAEDRFASTSSDIRPVLDRRAIPWLVMTYDQLIALPIDHRMGFVLSLVDGRCTVEMICDVSGLGEREAREILAELGNLGAIDFHRP